MEELDFKFLFYYIIFSIAFAFLLKVLDFIRDNCYLDYLITEKKKDKIKYNIFVWIDIVQMFLSYLTIIPGLISLIDTEIENYHKKILERIEYYENRKLMDKLKEKWVPEEMKRAYHNGKVLAYRLLDIDTDLEIRYDEDYYGYEKYYSFESRYNNESFDYFDKKELYDYEREQYVAEFKKGLDDVAKENGISPEEMERITDGHIPRVIPRSDGREPDYHNFYYHGKY